VLKVVSVRQVLKVHKVLLVIRVLKVHSVLVEQPELKVPKVLRVHKEQEDLKGVWDLVAHKVSKVQEER
jgi:hypothetical protein